MKRLGIVMSIGISLCGAIVFAPVNPWASAWAMGCTVACFALLWEHDQHGN